MKRRDCEMCGGAGFIDNGDPESGPNVVACDCPVEDGERRIESAECWSCHEAKRVTGERRILESFDPTLALELECGHIVF